MLLNSKILLITIFLISFSTNKTWAENTKEEKGHRLFGKFPVAKLKERPKNIFEIKRNFSKLKKDHLEELVRYLVQSGLRNRQVGDIHHKKVSDHLLSALAEIDTTKSGLVSVDSFNPAIGMAIAHYQKEFKDKIESFHKKESAPYKMGKTFTDSVVDFLKEREKLPTTIGRNIIWEKKGAIRPQEMIVVCAHYDTMTVKSDKDALKTVDAEGLNPGADDNASGVASAMALIKIFSQMEIPVTVRFVFLDWEEWAGLGSFAYFQKYKNEDKRVLGYVNLEALGHDSKTSDKERRHFNMRAYLSRPDRPFYHKEKLFLDALLEKGSKGVGQSIFKPVANSQVFEGDMGRWQDDIPAVTFSQNWQDDANDERIHTSNDFVETLNFTTLHKATHFIGIGLLAFLYGF